MKKLLSCVLSASMIVTSLTAVATGAKAEAVTSTDTTYTMVDMSSAFTAKLFLSKETAGTIAKEDIKAPDFYVGSSEIHTYTPAAISKESIDEYIKNSKGYIKYKGIPFDVKAKDNEKSAARNFTVNVPEDYYKKMHILIATPAKWTGDNNFYMEKAYKLTSSGQYVCDLEWAKVTDDDDLNAAGRESHPKLTVNTYEFTDVTTKKTSVGAWLQADASSRVLAVTLEGLKGDDWNEVIEKKISELPEEDKDVTAAQVNEITSIIDRAEKTGTDVTTINGIARYKTLRTKFATPEYTTVDLTGKYVSIAYLSAEKAGTITDDQIKAPDYFTGTHSTLTYIPAAISMEAMNQYLTSVNNTICGVPFKVDVLDNEKTACLNFDAGIPQGYYSAVKVLTATGANWAGNNGTWSDYYTKTGESYAAGIDWAKVKADDDVNNRTNTKSWLYVENWDIKDKTKLMNSVGFYKLPESTTKILAVTMAGLKGEEWEPVLKTRIAALADNVEDLNMNDFNEVSKLVEKAEKSGTMFAFVEGMDKFNRLKAEIDNLVSVTEFKTASENTTITAEITFDKAISASDVTKESFALTCGREAIDYTVAPIIVNEEVKGAKLTLKNSMQTADNYQLKVTIGGKSVYDTSFTIAKPITVTDYTSSIAGTALTATGKVANNTYTGSKAVKVITAVYENDKLYKTEISDKTVAKGTSEEFTNNITVEEGKEYTVQTFVWDSDMITPLALKKNKSYGIDAISDKTKDIKVAFIGGSITQGGNYTTPFIEKWQADRTGKITTINAGVGGTTSTFGAMRMYEDVLSKKPDMVFVEFALNDGSWMSKQEIQKNVESMIRQAYNSEHQPVISFIYIPQRATKEDGSYVMNTNVGYYNEVLNYYGLKGFNAHQLVLNAISSGNYTWDSFVAADNVHPNAEQGKKIADVMYTDFSNNFDSYVKDIAWNKVKGFNADDYNKPTTVASSRAVCDSNWSNVKVDGVVTEGYGVPTSMPFESFVASNTTGSVMTFKFSGTKLLISTLVGNDGRSADYVITNDEGVVEKSGTVSTLMQGYSWYENIILSVDGLNDTNHTLKITLKDGTGLFGIGEFWVDE